MNLYPRENLSAWDTLSVDEQGRPTNGYGDDSLLGYHAEAILDMLYICHPKADQWQVQQPWGKGVFAIIRDGHLVVGDVNIVVERGPRDGIHFAAWHFAGQQMRAMVGITVASQDAQGRWQGVLPDDVAALQRRLADWRNVNQIPAVLASITFAGAVRFNQGDRFQTRAGIPLPCTIPGVAEPPLIAVQGVLSNLPQEVKP